jgi:hypothetical protein
MFSIFFLRGQGSSQRTAPHQAQTPGSGAQEPPENIRLSDELRGNKDELLQVAQEFSLERPSRQKKKFTQRKRPVLSSAWVKFKITKSEEFVIGGYTLPEGNRKYLVRF